jgi:hypothetical protein
VIVGAVAMAIAAFLPLDEPSGAFRMVRDNTPIPHGGWMLIGLALGIAVSGYRVSQSRRTEWLVPIILCVIAAALIALNANDKGLRTLYPVRPDGTLDTSQPGMVANLGVAIYVAGAGVAAAFIGSLILRQSARVPDASDAPAVAKAATKKCPDCAETILADAKVCKHCGYRFAPAAASSAPSTAPKPKTVQSTPSKTASKSSSQTRPAAQSQNAKPTPSGPKPPPVQRSALSRLGRGLIGKWD